MRAEVAGESPSSLLYASPLETYDGDVPRAAHVSKQTISAVIKPLRSIGWTLTQEALLERVSHGVELVHRGVRFSVTRSDRARIELPLTDPLIVELSWSRKGEQFELLVEANADCTVDLEEEVQFLTLRTLAGDEYELATVETATGVPLSRVAPDPFRLSELVVWPLPKVSEADCYDLLGVAKSEYVDRYQSRGEMPPYVPREIDDELTQTLKSEGFVLLVGPSKAGKTRTAYEDVLRVARLTPMVVPSRAEDLGTIVEELKFWSGRPSRAVLWLNDLDKFLNKGTLTRRVADTALRELGMQIVATMRRKEYNGFKEKDDEIAREAQEVLNCAKVIKLDERMTPKEERLVREAYPDLNLEAGFGESFIAGQELKQRYNFGDPARRAVVRAANDWRRTGFKSPIQRADLFDLFKRHFEALAPATEATEELFKVAVEDACKPVARYSALLNAERSAEGEAGYYVVDYLSDYLENEGYPIVEEAWKLALRRVQSEADCVAVGIAAYEMKRSDIAERAWVTGVAYSSYECAYNLGNLLAEQGRPEEAEKAYREAIRINPQYADARNNLGPPTTRPSSEMMIWADCSLMSD